MIFRRNSRISKCIYLYIDWMNITDLRFFFRTGVADKLLEAREKARKDKEVADKPPKKKKARYETGFAFDNSLFKTFDRSQSPSSSGSDSDSSGSESESESGSSSESRSASESSEDSRDRRRRRPRTRSPSEDR
jgi:hypothetical protein